MKQVRFIYNPNAGETAIGEWLDRIAAMYQSRGMIVSLFRLDFNGPMDNALDGVDADFDHILIAGGDGTVNFVINLMKRSGIEIPVAVLPTGTANDFAKAFKMPSDIEKGVRAILDGEVRPVDLGVVNGKWFVNILSCGLFTTVSQNTPTSMKNIFGRLAYLAGGAFELANYHKIKLSIHSDGGDFEGDALTLLIFNGKTAGSLKLARSSELDDGLLDVLIIKGQNPIEAFHTVFLYVSGITRRYPREVEHIRCSRLTVDASGGETTDVDGQPGPDFPLDVWCDKGGLRVIRPLQKERKRKAKAVES